VTRQNLEGGRNDGGFEVQRNLGACLALVSQEGSEAYYSARGCAQIGRRLIRKVDHLWSDPS